MNDAVPKNLSVDEVIAGFADDGDTFLMIERLATIPNPLATADLYGQALMDAYWKRKDLESAVAVGRAGFQHALTAAARLPAADAEQAEQLRGKAKAISYNIASFTWPGWDEPGIVCTPALIAVGFDAANANLRLARDLKRGDLPLSRALWMLAGHHLARGGFGEAIGTYATAREHAVAAGSNGDIGLCTGFKALVRTLADSADAAAKEELEQAKAQLRTLGDDGAEFIRQIETAAKVFAKK
jgi:hypothetical protein